MNVQIGALQQTQSTCTAVIRPKSSGIQSFAVGRRKCLQEKQKTAQQKKRRKKTVMYKYFLKMCSTLKHLTFINMSNFALSSSPML